MAPGSRVLILGITFKENCPDIRNTKVIDVIKNLQDFGSIVSVYDPWADSNEVEKEYSLSLLDQLPNEGFDAIVLAVSHNDFLEMDLEKIKKNKCVVYDVKGVLEDYDERL